MFKHSGPLITLALLGALVGCTSGQSAVEPKVTQQSIAADKAQVAVGNMTWNTGAVVVNGTNVVATFRQPNGDSATLVNTPSLTGPAAWAVPAAPAQAPATGVDGGTNRITASPQIPNGVTSPAPVVDTLAQTGGVFSYGFAPDNVTASGAIVTTSYSQPFWAPTTVTERSFKGGPPAYPQERNGLSGGGTAFIGFPLGFLTLFTPSVAGTYNLNVNVTDDVGNSTNFPASATLTSTAALPAFGPPTSVVQDGAGGMTVNFVAPAGVTETLVEINDLNWCAAYAAANGLTNVGSVWYSVLVSGSGAKAAVLPANLGPTGSSASGCAPVAGRSVQTGDTYAIYFLGADYPLFEAGPPQNTSLTPTLTGAGGQSDITIYSRSAFVY